MHRNTISIVKPTRCTNVSNLFYFWNDTVHVSDGLSVHHQEFKTVHTATGVCQTDTAVCLLASEQQYPNIISMVKPTGCTNVLNIFYFGITLYMIRTVFPSIIRSSRQYIQQPNRYCRLLPASKLTAIYV